MTSNEFIHWLNGFMAGIPDYIELTPVQVKAIKEKLDTVVPEALSEPYTIKYVPVPPITTTPGPLPWWEGPICTPVITSPVFYYGTTTAIPEGHSTSGTPARTITGA